MTQMLDRDRYIEELRRELAAAYDQGDMAFVLACSHKLDQMQIALWKDHSHRCAS